MPFDVAGVDVDVAVLAAWYRRHVAGASGRLTSVEFLTAGRSNLTALVVDANGRRTVLRRPPPGDHHPSAHDVLREARIIDALAVSPVPVPRLLATSSEPSVIGAPFYVMEHVDGVVLEAPADAASLAGEERRSIAADLAHRLGELHELDPSAIGLGDLSRPTGFVERQLRRFRSQWQDVGDASLEARFEELHRDLVRRVPEQAGRASIVHGDFRIGNAIVSTGRVAAVLDWELTTLGEPLSDLAYLLNNWVGAHESDTGPITSAIAAGGFGARADVIGAYEDATGAPVDLQRLGFHRALSYWRLASIRSGVVRRLRTSESAERRSQAAEALASLPLLLDATHASLHREAVA